MIVEKVTFANGLTALLHEDKSSPLVVVNVLYKVGSRNEDSEKTGFAHLFEHLMFAGSKNVEQFDEVVQLAGGENNAFTNTDITNYYINLPAENLEVALWLEADRMQHLNINEKSLNVQKKVVVEEFKQRYLNKPYGDVSHIIRNLIYTKHPYRWPTIGLTPEHIENATLSDVSNFYEQWYSPNNAIISIVGNIDLDETYSIVEKWFGNIPYKIKSKSHFQEEPDKNIRTFLEVERNAPLPALFMAFLMPNRTDPNFYVYDMISDILGNGHSSRLYQALVKEKPIFQSLTSYVSGSIDKGFLMIEGKVNSPYTLKQAEEEIWNVLNNLPNNLTDYELQKVKNKYEANFISSLIDINSKAELLSFYEFVFDDFLAIYNEVSNYQAVTKEQVINILQNNITYNKSIVLYYK
jgi:predicted Zn-dependent peptidase